jgi:hypothetical protein
MHNARSVEPSAARQTPTVISPTDNARRRFLFTLGAGGASALAATASVLPASASSDADAAPSVDEDSAYRESDHVRHYYRTTRI